MFLWLWTGLKEAMSRSAWLYPGSDLSRDALAKTADAPLVATPDELEELKRIRLLRAVFGSTVADPKRLHSAAVLSGTANPVLPVAEARVATAMATAEATSGTGHAGVSCLGALALVGALLPPVASAADPAHTISADTPLPSQATAPRPAP